MMYLTAIRCRACGARVKYAHGGPDVPIDQEAPWPNDVQYCPNCREPYPDDLAVVTEEVANIKYDRN